VPTINEQVQSFWDIDAATYDHSASHHPRTALELAAWGAALRRLLPSPPARVLDVGAGTGFLSLLLARQGYEVEAMDLSPKMLERLREKAGDAGLQIRTVVGDAVAAPPGPFDAVVERHLLWTLPRPETALEAWRRSAPEGRLLLLEPVAAGGLAEQLRRAGRDALQRLRGEHDHHAHYDPSLRDQLPLATGATPEALVALVASSPWGAARIERLRDVEWAASRSLRSVADRMMGVPPRFAITAG